MIAIVCVCCMARCLQKPRDLHAALEDHGQNVNSIAELTLFMLRAECPLGVEISDKQLEVGASSLKVRACQPSLSAAIEWTPCSLVCHHASSVLADYPTLIVIFHRWKMTISRACGLT